MTPEVTLFLKEFVEYTTEAGKLAKEIGAVPVLKASGKGLMSYLGGLFKRNSQKDAVKAVEENPTDKEAVAELEVVLKNAVKDKEVEIAALKAEIEKFKALLAEHQPTANSNVQARIIDSKNLIIGSTFGNIGGSVTVGDNNGK